MPGYPAVIIGGKRIYRYGDHQRLHPARGKIFRLFKTRQNALRFAKPPLRRLHIDLYHFFSGHIARVRDLKLQGNGIRPALLYSS